MATRSTPAQGQAARPRSGRRWFWMLLLTLLVLGGVFGFRAVMSAQTNKFFDTMQMPPSQVADFAARTEEWSDAGEAVGSFTAVNGTDVTTESGGVVREIAFEPGQPVAAGAVLLRLNTANEVATLGALEASAKLAVAQRDRWRQLGADKLVSQAEIEQRAADAASQLAQVEAQRALIAQKTVRAPFAGVLGIRRVNLGQFVSPGDPIVSLQSLDPIFLDFTLPEQRMGAVLPGTAVRATVDALPGQVFEGRVTAVDPNADTATRNFRVQATFDNADHNLRPGGFARVTFDVAAPRKVVVVPQTAISFSPYGNAVFVIQQAPDDPAADKAARESAEAMGQPLPPGPRMLVRQRFIETGATRGDMIAVTKGLEAGERVATSGLLRLRNDAAVIVNNTVQPSSDDAPAPRNR